MSPSLLINKYFEQSIDLTSMNHSVVEQAAAVLTSDRRQGTAKPTEWFLVNTQSGTTLSLNREMVFIGRDKCEVVLESGSVENRHAVICFNPKDGSIYVRDLNTAHGSFVNDKRLPGPSYVRIQAEDTLRFGLSPQVFTVCNHIPVHSSDQMIQMTIPVTQTPVRENKSRSPACVTRSDSDAASHDLAPVLPESCDSGDAHSSHLSVPRTSLLPSPAPDVSPKRLPPSCEQQSQKPSLRNQAPESQHNISASVSQENVEAETPAVVSLKVHPSAFTISFDEDGKSPDREKKRLSIGDSIRKFAPKKSFDRNRRASKPPSTHSNQSPTETHEPRSLPIMSHNALRQNQAQTQLSDSAVFLIQRMFASDGRDVDAAGDEDEVKSEAGTYTLDTECQDNDLERARKMIDNVFGVKGDASGDVTRASLSAPDSPRSSRSNSCRRARSSLPKEIQRPHISSLQDETRNRTFTRSKPRRGSLQEQVLPLSPESEVVTFERSLSLRSKSDANARKSSPNSKVRRDRRESLSSTRSGLSSKTIEVRNTAIFNHVSDGRADVPSRKQGDGKRTSCHQTEHWTESGLSASAGHVPEAGTVAPSGLKVNRAFALRRARLGIETPGIPLNLTDDKQKKNQDNRSKQSVRDESTFARSDGGRFSLRASAKLTGRPPLPSSHPSSPEKRFEDRKQVQVGSCRSVRAASESNQNRLSPSSSSSSIPNSQQVQRSSSFGPQSCTRAPRSMTPMQVMTKRMFSVRPHHQQYGHGTRNKQQANVAPIKRSPDSSVPAPTMTASLHEQNPDPQVFASHQPVIQRRTLSSLDNLVVSAILQLSAKLRFGMREWLDQEKVKHAPGSETRLMIDEILPQVTNLCSNSADGSSTGDNLSKDLSTILKNLKKVEQSLEVISLLAALEPANLAARVTLSVAKDSKASSS